MPTHRMHRGLVALSASAVAAIYMAGYLRTQTPDATLGSTLAIVESTPSLVAVAATSTPIAPPVAQRPTPLVSQVGSAPRATPTPISAPAPQTTAPPSTGVAQTQTTYKDGTYTGQGSSRRGDVWVSVQILAGRIANVTITRSTLQYPLRDIANLPSQVVQRQSTQVDVVSRATYSSMAFREAVAQALSGAQVG